MESETKENNLSLSQDEEDVNLKNDTKPDVNNITKLEEDKIINETETVDKESYEKLLHLYEFVTSDEFLKKVGVRAKHEDKSLHIASALGKLDMVEKLLEMGHDINIKNEENKTPLYFAVEYNHLSIVKFLIENNAFINAKDKDNGFTPLHISVQNKNLDIVKFLVKNNAFIDAQDKVRSFTPLHYAVQDGNLDIVKFLVENNAFIGVQDDALNQTPLHWAIRNNNTEIVEYLCSQKDSSHLRSKDKQAKTPLALARSFHVYNYRGFRQTIKPEIIKIIENRLKF